MRRIIAALILALIPTMALQPVANADYGAGYFTYNEWLSLHSGQTKAGVEATCNCSGYWANSPGTNPKVFWYDNTLSGGHVAEYYVYQYIDNVGWRWRTFGSYWCDASFNCQQDF